MQELHAERITFFFSARNIEVTGRLSNSVNPEISEIHAIIEAQISKLARESDPVLWRGDLYTNLKAYLINFVTSYGEVWSPNFPERTAKGNNANLISTHSCLLFGRDAAFNGPTTAPLSLPPTNPWKMSWG